ncbi:MAG: F0F1 ATP synthase subunit B [Rhodospirillales bacterium]|nr:F0F1 ATP synthase subunit B [Rhodospirillales bacterium]
MPNDPNLYLWIALIVLIALIVWKGGSGIVAGLDAKVQKIRQAIDEAEALKVEAEKTLAEYKRKQRDALAEAERIVAHAKTKAEEIRSQQLAELKISLERREQLAMDRIAQAEANALRAVQSGAVDAAIAASIDLIRAKLNEARSGAMIDASIDEISRHLN